MATDTATQGWDDSRFADTLASLTLQHPGSGAEVQELLRQLATTVRNELPFIEPEFLRFESSLGKGNSFEVSKELLSIRREEPHYVAVKRIVMRRKFDDVREFEDDDDKKEALKRFQSVMREVRVLTHSKLRSHSCLVSAIGWGWTVSTLLGARPYLVMRFSAYGTLVRFSQRAHLTLLERRSLALDVAFALQALHENGIIHGDVKTENVLVYDAAPKREDNDKSFLARLSDFGCALFSKDFVNENQYYYGTPIYNAPEISHWKKKNNTIVRGYSDKFDQYKAADCYSFGFLLYETMNRGAKFVKDTRQNSDERALDFLERVFGTDDNHVLKLAKGGLNQVESDVLPQFSFEGKPDPRVKIQEDNMLPEARLDLIAILQKTVALCLQDSPILRGSIQHITATLAEGTENTPPLNESFTAKYMPIATTPEHGGLLDRKSDAALSWGSKDFGYIKGMYASPDKTVRSVQLRPVSGETPPDPSRQLTRYEPKGEGIEICLAPQYYHYKHENLFKAVRRRQPRWEVQRELAASMQQAVETEDDPVLRAQAHLQLAIMKQVGYGMAPNSTEALRQLEAARKDNEVARAIFQQVHEALHRSEEAKKKDEYFRTGHITYRDPIIYYAENTWRHARQQSSSTDSVQQTFQLGEIVEPSENIFKLKLRKRRYEPAHISAAFSAACRDGHLEVATLLAEGWPCLSQVNKNLPNPLHWLVNLSDNQAVGLFQCLLTAAQGRASRLSTLLSLLECQPKQTIFLPHRCIQLRGNPLHWAVAAGYTKLVETFVGIGADIDAKTHWHEYQDADSHTVHLPSLSPLDLAVAGHFYRIVLFLLERGSKVTNTDWRWSHSPLHMVGYNALPFAHYVAHGKNYRNAVRETIQALISEGIDINVTDSRNLTPLQFALTSLDIEKYVIEELLEVGASVGAEGEGKEVDLLVSTVLGYANRQLSSATLTLLLPLVKDINSKDDKDLAVLHYCAMLNLVRSTEILLNVPGIDVNILGNNNSTPLSLAAQRGSIGVLELLISNGANLSLGDAIGSALSSDQVEAACRLVDAGHPIRCQDATFGILHRAVRSRSNRPSHVRALLDKCERLRQEDSLNCLTWTDVVPDEAGISFDFSIGMTPLQMAAVCGDVDGVSALLKYGANICAAPADKYARFTPLRMVERIIDRFKFTVGSSTITDVSHPIVDEEIGKMTTSEGHLIKGVETRFTDCMNEIHLMLQEAEAAEQSKA